jgi:hypothetical protein
VLKIPPEIESANERLVKRFKIIALVLLTLGLIFPNEWRQILGIFGEPISWMAETIPSARKSAAVSPIRDLVQGFFGAVFLLGPLFYATFMWRDPIGTRFKYAWDKAPSKTTFVLIIYFLVVPTLSFVVYVVFFLPIDAHIGLTPTRGQFVFSLMISYRFALALFGTFVMLGVYATLWFLTVLIAGPLFYVHKKLTTSCDRIIDSAAGL